MTIIKPLLDENLPEITDITLREWCRTYDSLRSHRKDDNDDAAEHFALTGHYTDSNTNARLRAKLDYRRQELERSTKFHQVTDIDSVIGIVTDNFPIQDDAIFEYHLINDARYCLSSSLHIPGWPDPTEQGRTNKLLEFEKLPHGVFGVMDQGRTVIRVFFPNALEQVEDSPFLTGKHLEPFYDQVVRPAAAETVSDHYFRAWPPSYAAELTRASNRKGGPQFSGKSMRGQHLSRMIPKMREYASRNPELTWCKDFFFMVEMKGVKAGTTHPPPDGDNLNPDGTLVDPDHDPRSLSLNNLLSSWRYADFEADDWYLDIATTISATQADDTPISLLIRKDAHQEIIRYFTQQSVEQCAQWASDDDGRDYQFDETAQLGPIGGFRLTVRGATPNGVRYFQAYTTEKSLVYHKKAGSVALNSSPFKVLDNWEHEESHFFDPVTDIFQEASNTGTKSHIAVRFESRAPFEVFPAIHHKIPELNLREWLYGFNTRAVWGFKGRRMRALTTVLDRILTHRSQIQWSHVPEVASLIVVLVWMANALANRPASGGTWNVVKDSSRVHQTNRLGRVEACSPLTNHAIHSLRRVPVYRFSSHRVIDEEFLLRLFSTKAFHASIADLYVLLNPPIAERSIEPVVWDDQPAQLGTIPTQPARGNKRRKVNTTPGGHAHQVFGSQEGQIPIPCLDGLSLDQYDSEEEDPEARSVGPVTCEELSELLHKVAVQIFAKAPNHQQSNKSYCLLEVQERATITNTVFYSKEKLATTWLSYTLFNSPEKWDNTVQRLFPTRAEYRKMTTNSRGEPIRFQGLHTLSFWTNWQTLLERLPTDSQAEVVKAVRTHINQTWRWFPLIEGGKLWNTTQKSGQRHVGELPTGPWIACNPYLI